MGSRTGTAVGLAILAVLQRLAPAERVAFVLHDVFGVSFEEIAGIASRGRRRVQGASEDGRAADVARQRDIVEAFFRASRAGDSQALLAVLDPDAALRGDEACDAYQRGAFDSSPAPEGDPNDLTLWPPLWAALARSCR